MVSVNYSWQIDAQPALAADAPALCKHAAAAAAATLWDVIV